MTVLRLRQWPSAVDYRECWQAMRKFTEQRDAASDDELWLVEHPPVYTHGVRGEAVDTSIAGIPVVKSDRGGLVTYHGPGQLVAYVLIDLPRLGLGLRRLVELLEQAVIEMLAALAIDAQRRPGAPGIYVAGRKLSSLGLRVLHGRSYHGLSLNVEMDLRPFSHIVPCGLDGIEMTDLRRLGVTLTMPEVAARLATAISRQLGYTRLDPGQGDVANHDHGTTLP